MQGKRLTEREKLIKNKRMVLLLSLLFKLRPNLPSIFQVLADLVYLRLNPC